MGDFFSRDPIGAPFQMFDTPHLIALAVVLLINGLLIGVGSRFPRRWRRPFRIGLAVVLLVNEGLWHVWNVHAGQWTVQTMIPLHLCSVLVFLSAIMLITKSTALFEVAYFLGIAGASQALLTPDVGAYGYPHFRFFQSLTSHGSIVTAAVYMTFVEGYRPWPRSFLRIFVGGNVYMLLVGAVNAVLGSNYLFIAHKPETPSLIDLLPPWPWYILFLELIALLLMGLLYLPYAVRDWRSRQTVSGSAV